MAGRSSRPRAGAHTRHRPHLRSPLGSTSGQPAARASASLARLGIGVHPRPFKVIAPFPFPSPPLLLASLPRSPLPPLRNKSWRQLLAINHRLRTIAERSLLSAVIRPLGDHNRALSTRRPKKTKMGKIHKTLERELHGNGSGRTRGERGREALHSCPQSLLEAEWRWKCDPFVLGPKTSRHSLLSRKPYMCLGLTERNGSQPELTVAG